MTFELKKAGAAAKVVLMSDVAKLSAGQREVAQVEVDVTDKEGTLVGNAANGIECAISGPGRIIGIENGNLNSTEGYKALSHSVYQGRMLVYVETLGRAGDVKLTVKSAGLEGATLDLPVR